MDLSVRGILKMWCALVAVPLGAGVVCISMSQTPEVGPSYTLKSWQNQPGKPDQTDHRQVREGSLMVCTTVEPRKDGNECLLKYENDGKMSVQFHQAITATSTDEVSLSCVSQEPTEPVSCEATITVPKGDAYFVTGDMSVYPLVTIASSRKLSVTAPEVNRCILDTIRDSVMAFGPPEKDFAHRYITDKGSLASREYRNAMEQKIFLALYDGHFKDAERVEEQAVKIGYSVVNKTLIQKARREYGKLKSGQITKEEYDSRLTDLEAGDLLR